MAKYRSRVLDVELGERMSAIGALLVGGPKAVGKTSTAQQVARTAFRMDVDRAAGAALEIQPDQLFSSPTPIVFDERQEAPDLWNLVRRAVDDHDEKGLYLLTGSSRPRDTVRMHSGAGRIGRLRMHSVQLDLEAIVDAARQRGELGPGAIPSMVLTAPVWLLRSQALDLTITDQMIDELVDNIALPLYQAHSASVPHE